MTLPSSVTLCLLKFVFWVFDIFYRFASPPEFFATFLQVVMFIIVHLIMDWLCVVCVYVCTHSTVLLHAGGSLSVMNAQLVRIVAMMNKLNKVLLLRNTLKFFYRQTMCLTLLRVWRIWMNKNLDGNYSQRVKWTKQVKRWLSIKSVDDVSFT